MIYKPVLTKRRKCQADKQTAAGFRKDMMNMQQVFVKFDSAEQVVDFVNVVNKCDAEFELRADQRACVNAKSLIGVLSLDFTNPLYLCYSSHDEEIENKILPFTYKK